MTANETEGGAEVAPARTAKPRKPAGGGLGGGVWAAYAMALLLGSRTLINLTRSLGPVVGGVLLAAFLGGIPLVLGFYSWRERREEQARAARWRERAAGKRGGAGGGERVNG